MTPETLADLLETLVNFPSETGQEKALADWVTQRLAARGGGEILRSGHSVVWRGPSDSIARPLLVLAGHLDTVPANGNATARRVGDRLYGLGSTDMKSGDVVMLALLESLDPGDLRFDLAGGVLRRRGGPARPEWLEAPAERDAVAQGGAARDPARAHRPARSSSAATAR